jgi:hypothetical protein
MLGELAPTKSRGRERVLARRLVEPVVMCGGESESELRHAALTPQRACPFHSTPPMQTWSGGNKSPRPLCRVPRKLRFRHARSQRSDGSTQIVAAGPKCPGKNGIGRVGKIMKACALFLGVDVPIEKIDGAAEGDDERSDLRHLFERCLQLVHDGPRVCSV